MGFSRHVLRFSFLIVWMLCFVPRALGENVTAKVSPRPVILISVDGLGAELLHQASMPELKRLTQQGAQAKRAETVSQMQTLPGHASMLSGVFPEVHGVLRNDLSPQLRPLKVPTIFHLLEQQGLRSSAVMGKTKLKFILQNAGITSLRQPTAPVIGELYGQIPSVVAKEAINELQSQRPSLLFVHFAAADKIGHWFHWESWPQLLILERIDQAIGELDRAAERILGDEGYVLIVTADHGGHRGSHGQRHADGSIEDRERDLVIPWIIKGAPLLPTVEVVEMIDTAPTVADLLGLTVPPSWRWNGKSVIGPSSAPKVTAVGD